MSSPEHRYLVPQVESEESFEFELANLIRNAERQGLDLTMARDVDAVDDGYWMVEISRVEPDASKEETGTAFDSLAGNSVTVRGNPDGI